MTVTSPPRAGKLEETGKSQEPHLKKGLGSHGFTCESHVAVCKLHTFDFSLTIHLV